MKDIRKSLLIGLLFLVIAMVGIGCTSTRGYIGHSINTEVHLSQANFEVIKSVTGEAKADYYFMIGTSEQDLLGLAKRNMIKRANLKGSQAIMNVSTDIQVTGFFFWQQKKAFVSGEVVEFK